MIAVAHRLLAGLTFIPGPYRAPNSPINDLRSSASVCLDMMQDKLTRMTMLY